MTRYLQVTSRGTPTTTRVEIVTDGQIIDISDLVSSVEWRVTPHLQAAYVNLVVSGALADLRNDLPGAIFITESGEIQPHLPRDFTHPGEEVPPLHGPDTDPPTP